MLTVPTPKDPVVLSYHALRQAVGYVALGLPFVVSIGWWLFGGHVLENSISSYYYTGMRNIFVGSLCAISMFQLCCRGYDPKDEIAGIFSAIFALGVAFFPTTPDVGATPHQKEIGTAHYTFAALLFLTLAYFCLFLFRMSAADRKPTPQKLQRNNVYTVCGCVILGSLITIFVLKFLNVEYFGKLGTVSIFETTSLLAFGIAWLAKGEAFLSDK